MKYCCVYLLIIFLISCKEKFDDNLPFSDTNALVVEGEINDGHGPYLVRLSRSASFNSKEIINVSNAIVYVTDDSNRLHDFKETDPGIYLSDSSEFKAKIGGVYILHINTSDGLKYESSPCIIGPPCRLDSIYKSDFSINGMQLKGGISFGSAQNISAKIDADIAISYDYDTIILDVYQGHFDSFIRENHFVTTIFITQHLNYEPVLKSNTDYVKGSKLTNVPMFNFYPPIATTDTLVYDAYSATAFSKGMSYALIISLSTISNETFNFYKNLQVQTGGRDVFFEPIPVQLNGNITCINNKTKTAFGLFQANSTKKKYFIIDSLFNLVEVDSIQTINHQNWSTRREPQEWFKLH